MPLVRAFLLTITVIRTDKNGLKQMADEVKGTETTEPIPAQIVEDLESKNAVLEAEKSKLIEEAANYRVAYLKERSKKLDTEDESEDDKIRRITQETLANSRIAEIAREQDALIKKALKENKELKLAIINKTDLPVSVGVHSETQPVKDTSITDQQMNAFKARGWSDKDIERYKKNLSKFGGR